MTLPPIEIPLATRNDSNGQRGHWAVTAKKRANEKAKVRKYLLPVKVPKAYRVTLTRLGGREMDHAGLLAALKAAQDAVAGWLGVDDRPSGPAEWIFRQEPGARPEGEAVRVEVVVLAQVGARLPEDM